MRTLGVLILLAAFLLCLPEDCRAKIYESQVIDKASIELIETILEDKEVPHDAVGSKGFVLKIDGCNMAIGATKGGDMYMICYLDNEPSLSLINSWNRSKRFSRAYLSEDGTAVLEAELDFSGGVTAEAINNFIGLFAVNVGKFTAYVK